MATKKKEAAAKTPEGRTASEIEAFEAAQKEYQVAVELLYRQEYAAAKERFLKIAENNADEAEMAEQCRTYSRICDNKLAGEPTKPESADDCYHRAVMLSNDGRPEQAVALLDMALVQDPTSVRVLYARACAWALQRNAERAVSDLRSAIAGDQTVRFQATNDTDFEKIREEPAFIDVIEPTPAGA